MCCIQLVTGQLYAELVRKLLVTSLAGSNKFVSTWGPFDWVKNERKNKRREKILFSWFGSR